jgi:uncharacterized protein (UPF0332 family)
MAAFEDCLAKGRLKKIEPDIEKVAHELATAKEELERARSSIASGNWNDTAMQSYFAMTRCARAAINARGYRDTNLYGLEVGLKRLFVETGELPDTIGKQIRDAKDVKDAVYNGRRATPDEARRLLGWMQTFAKAVFARLALPGFDAEEVPTNIPEPVDPQRSSNASSEREPQQPDWRGRFDRGRSSGRGRDRYGAPRRRDSSGGRYGAPRRDEPNGNRSDTPYRGEPNGNRRSEYRRPQDDRRPRWRPRFVGDDEGNRKSDTA